MVFLSDETTRCPQARSRDIGGDPNPRCAAGAGRGEPRAGDQDAGLLEPLHLQLAGDVSVRRVGRVEGEAYPRAAEEAQGAGHPLGVPDGDGQESSAAWFSVCAVDALDDCELDRQAHRGAAEPGVGWASAGAARTDLSEAVVACLPAGRIAG